MNIMEKLGQGTSVLVVGMGVVFLVLLILMCVAILFKYIFKDAAKKETQKSSLKQTQQAAQAPKAAKTAEFKPGFDIEDGEIVAVIASSIAAALNTGSGDIKIRSIRKVD